MADLVISNQKIVAGAASSVDIFVGRLAEQTEVFMNVQAVRGEADGPTVFVTGCVHGDEVNGFEIVRQIKRVLDPKTLRGTVLLVPVVNVFGFIFRSRYLPDRRDLNRSFPGTARGSQAARLAHVLMTEIVAKCDAGIDLHTGPLGRYNLPQAWCDPNDVKSLELGQAFGAPVMLHSPSKDGTLRHAAASVGVPVVLFEGGEAMRFDADSIRHGTEGALRVLKKLDMIDEAPEAAPSVVIENMKWVRARRAGAFRPGVNSGHSVEKQDRLAAISDPLGHETFKIRAPLGGLVLSHGTSPLVNRGDAIFRIGY